MATYTPDIRNQDGYLHEVLNIARKSHSRELSADDAIAQVGLAMMDAWFCEEQATSMPQDVAWNIADLAEIRLMEATDYLRHTGEIS